MKRLMAFMVFISLCFFSLHTIAQKTGHSEFRVQIDENTVVRDSFGTRIPYTSLLKMLSTGNYTLDPQRDKYGHISEYQLRVATTADKGKRETHVNIPGENNLPGPKVGADMPSFTVRTMDSTIINSEDLKGKVIVINFWFTLCKPCIYEMPDINKLAESYKGRKDIIFLAPNFEQLSKVKTFLARQPISYIVCPLAGDMVDKFGVAAYPTHLVISKSGKILNSYVGGLPGIDEILKHDIQNALAQ